MKQKRFSDLGPTQFIRPVFPRVVCQKGEKWSSGNVGYDDDDANDDDDDDDDDGDDDYDNDDDDNDDIAWAGSWSIAWEEESQTRTFNQRFT